MNLRNSLLSMLATAFVLAAFPAPADEYHYTNLLIGDRAAGMGGAYLAVSDDATGLYYNPAGIAYTTSRNVSASVNAYYSQTKEYSDVIGGSGWKRTSSTLLPNYFGIVLPLGEYKIGFSYAVPDSSMEDQDQSFPNPGLSGGTPPRPITRYIINFNNEDTTYNFGPSVSRQITSNFSAGATLYWFEKRRQWILNQLIIRDDGQYQWSNDYYERNESGFRPVLGLMWSPVERLSLGFTVSQVLLAKSTTNVQSTLHDFGDPANILSRTDASTSTKRKMPLQFGAGAAYFATKDLLITGDLTYYPEVKDPVFGDKISVVNGALGAEYYPSRTWAVRAGFYTDIANTPDIVAGKPSTAEEKVDLYGGTFSVSYFTRNTSVTLGTGMHYGKGKAQITGNVNAVQDLTTQGMMIFLSSSYSY